MTLPKRSFFAWFGNALQRTLTAFFPALASYDERLAASRLSSGELRLFKRMDPRDRQHAVQVAEALLRREPGASDALVRAALLHDVGKSERPYRAWERIFVHVLKPRFVAAEPRRGGLAGVWQLVLHHAEYGAELIRAEVGPGRVADLVERHHRPGTDREARLLQEVDAEF